MENAPGSRWSFPIVILVGVVGCYHLCCSGGNIEVDGRKGGETNRSVWYARRRQAIGRWWGRAKWWKGAVEKFFHLVEKTWTIEWEMISGPLGRSNTNVRANDP